MTSMQSNQWIWAALLLTACLLSCTDQELAPKAAPNHGLSAQYTPQAGDLIFQSSPHSPLVDLIEGASESHYSHCGILAQENGQWVVYEASRTVVATPYDTFINRGRGQGFAVYRFKDAYQGNIPDIIEKTHAYLGQPYDFRYRLDEEHIYCSELIYKAFEKVTGQPLGKLTKMSDLKWQPYEKLIKELEGGPVPLDRQIITPIDLALAEQLEPVFSKGFEITTP